MVDKKYDKIGDPIVKLAEECSELIEQLSKLIHKLCKAQRFGIGNWHPDDPQQKTNHELILKEIKDVDKRMRDYRDKYGYISIDQEIREKTPTNAKELFLNEMTCYCSENEDHFSYFLNRRKLKSGLINYITSQLNS